LFVVLAGQSTYNRRFGKKLSTYYCWSAHSHLLESYLHPAAEMVQLDHGLDVNVGYRGFISFW